MDSFTSELRGTAEISHPAGSTAPAKRVNSTLSLAMSHRILGLSAFYHDSAAALVVGGEIVAAAQEERFTRS